MFFRLGVAPEQWLLVLVFVFLCGCATSQATTGLIDNRFSPCPESPNCVSSDATDEEHRVEPYRLKAPPINAWHGLQNVLAAEKLIRLIEANDVYMHVVEESAVMRFIDDTEFHLRPDQGIIAVRSVARNRRSDGGSNRDRVERIRTALQARELVE